jgi:hypothetical protein
MIAIAPTDSSAATRATSGITFAPELASPVALVEELGLAVLVLVGDGEGAAAHWAYTEMFAFTPGEYGAVRAVPPVGAANQPLKV